MALRVTFSRSEIFAEGSDLDEHQQEYVSENNDVKITGEFFLTVYVDGKQVAQRYYGDEDTGDYEFWQLAGSGARYDLLTVEPA